MILIKECEVFAPENLGRKDVLIAGQKIVAIAKRLNSPTGVDVEVVSAKGLRLIPGLIDGHEHIAGAGGEGGPATRTPEVQLSRLLAGGITTVVGCLGTDGFTRSVESVLMKAKALRHEGISAWIYTGSYQVPTPTILGDIGRDLALIEEVIGVGEIAVSDHRSSCPTVQELIRLAAQARVGGLLGGKAGIVNLHMGDAQNPFAIIYEVIQNSEIMLTQFLPTHCNRNHYIFEDAKSYAKKGYVDVTTGGYPFYSDSEIKPSHALAELLQAGVPLEHITFSSDGCGSMPLFDKEGVLKRLLSGEPKTLFQEMIDAHRREKLTLEQALKPVTANVADVLKLAAKGRVAVGGDADLVLLDREDRIRHLLARGEFLMREGKILRKGTFEA